MDYFHTLDGAGIKEDKRMINAKSPWTLAHLNVKVLQGFYDNPAVPPSMKTKLKEAMMIKPTLKKLRGGLKGVSKASGFIRRLMWENQHKHEGEYKKPTWRLAPDSKMNSAEKFHWGKLASEDQGGENKNSYGASPFINQHFKHAKPVDYKRSESKKQKEARLKFMTEKLLEKGKTLVEAKKTEKEVAEPSPEEPKEEPRHIELKDVIPSVIIPQREQNVQDTVEFVKDKNGDYIEDDDEKYDDMGNLKDRDITSRIRDYVAELMTVEGSRGQRGYRSNKEVFKMAMDRYKPLSDISDSELNKIIREERLIRQLRYIVKVTGNASNEDQALFQFHRNNEGDDDLKDELIREYSGLLNDLEFPEDNWEHAWNEGSFPDTPDNRADKQIVNTFVKFLLERGRGGSAKPQTGLEMRGI